MYPSLEKELIKDLTQKSEKYIISYCGRKFKEMLM